MMRVVSLCTGIGGFDLACEATGRMEIVGQVEIDPFCNRVLEKYWPQVKRLHDIRQVVGDEFGAVHLVVAGFPASRHHTRASAEVRLMLNGSGPKLSGSLDPDSPLGCCLKTLLGSLAWGSSYSGIGGAAGFYLLRQVGDQSLGGEYQRGDRGRLLQG